MDKKLWVPLLVLATWALGFIIGTALDILIIKGG